MKVAIDCRLWKAGGVGRYIRNLTRSMILARPDHRYVLIVSDSDDAAELTEFHNVARVVDKSCMYGAKEHVSIPVVLARHQVDIYHETFHYLPYFMSIPSVITVHDTMRLVSPEWSYTNLQFIRRYGLSRFFQMILVTLVHARNMSSGAFRSCISASHGICRHDQDSNNTPVFKFHHAYQVVTIAQMLRRASGLIAVSENTKNDLIRIFGLPDERIEVVYEAADPIFKPVENIETLQELRNKFHIAERFGLFVGNWRPHKNLYKLLLAFRELVSKRDLQCELVLLGDKACSDGVILDLISEINNRRCRVKILRDVSDEELRGLYNLAAFTVLPSMYEGFGLPVTEAQACGCAVIVSNRGSLKEIVDRSGLLVNPESVDEIMGAMQMLFEDRTLNESYRNKGLKRARNFSWDDAARKTLQIYSLSHDELASHRGLAEGTPGYANECVI